MSMKDFLQPHANGEDELSGTGKLTDQEESAELLGDQSELVLLAFQLGFVESPEMKTFREKVEILDDLYENDQQVLHYFELATKVNNGRPVDQGSKQGVALQLMLADLAVQIESWELFDDYLYDAKTYAANLAPRFFELKQIWDRISEL